MPTSRCLGTYTRAWCIPSTSPQARALGKPLYSYVRAEIDTLKTQLSVFDQRIEYKFGELNFTDDTVKQVIEQVVLESRAKFDETGVMGARFESVVMVSWS